jgi:hypothetical protein
LYSSKKGQWNSAVLSHASLEAADGSTWQKTGIHPEYELYSLSILGRHILMHDFWHMYRIEELWLTRDAYLTKLE